MRKVLKRSDMTGFIQLCIDQFPVVGPVRKHTRFAFAPIENARDLVLDYDVTISSPKKFFFPPKEKLLEFNLVSNEVKEICAAEKVLLFGVHAYDINAIQVLDTAMNYDGKPDINYTKKREHSLIIGIDHVPHMNNFSKFLGQDELSEKAKKITDVFITPFAGNYLFETYTEKGNALLEKYNRFRDVTANDDQVLAVVREKKQDQCTEKLNMDLPTLHAHLKQAWTSSVWEEFAEKCFSCGSCNLVCPTCYCFDMEDDIELNVQEGHRERRWDSCMLTRFAEVAGGENFREHRVERLRHRLMKKGMYMIEKYDGPGCVGCGRCTIACTADINPVDVFNRIQEVQSK